MGLFDDIAAMFSEVQTYVDGLEERIVALESNPAAAVVITGTNHNSTLALAAAFPDPQPGQLAMVYFEDIDTPQQLFIYYNAALGWRTV
jgi:hypothetical protein